LPFGLNNRSLQIELVSDDLSVFAVFGDRVIAMSELVGLTGFGNNGSHVLPAFTASCLVKVFAISEAVSFYGLGEALPGGIPGWGIAFGMDEGLIGPFGGTALLLGRVEVVPDTDFPGFLCVVV
jgi:hypothetical protein